MKTILLTPPEREVYAPMLALPSLAAYIRENGYNVIQRDISAELIDYFLNKEVLEKLYHKCKLRFEYLNSKQSLSWEEQFEFANYLSRTFSRFPYYIKNINEIKSRMMNVDNYVVDSNGRPVLEDDWLVVSEIKNFLFQSAKKVTPFKIRELSTEVLFYTIAHKDELHYCDYYENVVVPSIKDEEPQIVGISITFPDQVIPGLMLAHSIKTTMPDVHITIGGSHFSLLEKELPLIPELFTFIDSFVINEGEESLLSLIKCIESGSDLSCVPNLIYKSGNEILSTELQAIKNIKELPCPDFDGVSFDNYLLGKPVLPYAFSRGCYWGKCTFCNFHHTNLKYRIREPEKIVEDLKKLKERYNTNLFYFTHEADPPARMKKIFTLIKEANLGIRYFTFCRFDEKVDLELLNLLKETGCMNLYFGLESGNYRVNTLINKGIDYNVAKRILRDAADMKLVTSVSSIYSFPTETQEEQLDTTRFYGEMVDQNLYAAGGSHIFRLAKGSPVEQDYSNFGIEEVFYETSGNLNTVLNFHMKKDLRNEKTQDSKKQLRINLAKLQRSYSLTSDYMFLVFSRLTENDYEKWLRYRKGITLDHKANVNDILQNDYWHDKKFKLSSNVKIIELNFPLDKIKQAVNRRSNLVYNLFYNEGIPVEKIIEDNFMDEEDIQQERQLFICETDGGEHMLLRLQWKPFVENLKEKNSFDDLLHGFIAERKDTALQQAVKSNVEKTLAIMNNKQLLQITN